MCTGLLAAAGLLAKRCPAVERDRASLQLVGDCQVTHLSVMPSTAAKARGCGPFCQRVKCDVQQQLVAREGQTCGAERADGQRARNGKGKSKKREKHERGKRVSA